MIEIFKTIKTNLKTIEKIETVLTNFEITEVIETIETNSKTVEKIETIKIIINIDNEIVNTVDNEKMRIFSFLN